MIPFPWILQIQSNIVLAKSIEDLVTILMFEDVIILMRKLIDLNIFLNCDSLQKDIKLPIASILNTTIEWYQDGIRIYQPLPCAFQIFDKESFR